MQRSDSSPSAGDQTPTTGSGYEGRNSRERITMGADQRYWQSHPARDPGDLVAEHDGFQGGAPGSGPGNYRIEVRRVPRWSITLSTSEGKELCVFNRGMARWFGLRLLEAAVIDELREADLAGWQAGAELATLTDWMAANAADWQTTGDSPVSSAIALLTEAKQLLADHQDLRFAELGPRP